MADAGDRLRDDGRGPFLDLASRAIDALVAEAPADYDQVMQAAPVAPGWVRVLVFVAALVLSWTLLILVAVAVWHAASRPN